MKSELPDDGLGKVLREWRVQAELPPRFQESVWKRIERGESPAPAPFWSVIAQWFATVLPRPAVALAYVAVVVALGATAGWAQARQESAQVRDQLGERYIHVLDPYAAPRA